MYVCVSDVFVPMAKMSNWFEFIAQTMNIIYFESHSISIDKANLNVLDMHFVVIHTCAHEQMRDHF